jgi:hypothetical protein
MTPAPRDQRRRTPFARHALFGLPTRPIKAVGPKAPDDIRFSQPGTAG